MVERRVQSFNPTGTHYHMLGASGPLHPKDQTKPLYDSESSWRDTNLIAGKSISIEAARDKIGEIIHSPSSDHFPGIDRVRAEYDPKNVRDIGPGGSRKSLPPGLMAGTDMRGRVYIKRQALNLGVVTHEAAHLANTYGQQFTGQGLNEDPEKQRTGGRKSGTPGFAHQWAFARAHLHVIHYELAKTAAKDLHEIYEQHGVQYRPPKD